MILARHRRNSGVIAIMSKDTILLWLIKERFDTDSAFADWLDEKGIPSELMSWV